MFNTKLRTMPGLIMLAILSGLFITGIEAPRNPRKRKQDKETSQSEEMIENKFTSMDFVEDSAKYEIQKTAMKKDSLPTVDFIEGLKANPLLPDHVLNKELTTMFFRKERKILTYVESLYQIGEQHLGMLRDEEQKFSLVYITFLSFWISVNFKFCSINFSFISLRTEQRLKSVCDSHFETMAFAFSEFKKILGSNEIEFEDERLKCAEYRVLQLDLEFLMNKDELKQKQESTNLDYLTHIRRPGVSSKKLNRKDYKTIFDNISLFRQKYLDHIGGRFSKAAPSIIFQFLIDGLMSQIDLSTFLHLCKIFRDQIYGKDYELELYLLWTQTWFIFNNTKQMWQHVAKDEFGISMDAGKLDCIQRAIKLIYAVRNVDYTLLYSGLPV